MLSIGRIDADNVHYHAHEDDHSEARWIGTGTRSLGFEPGEPAIPSQVLSVLSGRHPSTDSPLLTGARAPRDGDRDRRLPGWDLAFSAPKSVSVLAALSSPQVHAEVLESQRCAVEAALSYLEGHLAWVRRGHAGQQALDSTGFVAFEISHATSRLGDPQIHSHVVLSALSCGTDGLWSAWAGRLHPLALAAGCLYAAELRSQLSERLGVGWGEARKGLAEVVGVPRDLAVRFSKRRQQIVEELLARGEGSARAAQSATLRTRPKKDRGELSADECRERWVDEARQLGFDPQEIVRTALSQHGEAIEPSADEISDAGQRVLALDGPILARRTAFREADVIVALASEPAFITAGAGALLEGSQLVLEEPSVTQLRGGRAPRWSTHEALAAEAALAAQVKGLQGVVGLYAAGELVEHSQDLSPKLRKVASQVVDSAEGAVMLVAPTAQADEVLKGVARAQVEAERSVVVVAKSQDAVQRWKGVTGVRVVSPRKLGAAKPGSLVIVDRSSALGRGELEQVVAQVGELSGGLVLAADPNYLGETFSARHLVAVRGTVKCIEVDVSQEVEVERGNLRELDRLVELGEQLRHSIA